MSDPDDTLETARVLILAGQVSTYAMALAKASHLPLSDVLAMMGTAQAMAIAYAVGERGSDLEDSLAVAAKTVRKMTETFLLQRKFDA